jgi:hypothetical protein
MIKFVEVKKILKNFSKLLEIGKGLCYYVFDGDISSVFVDNFGRKFA